MGFFIPMIDLQSSLKSQYFCLLDVTARIAIPLRDSYFHVGSTAVVPCYVEGAPKPTIRWLRNGLAIPPVSQNI